MTLDLPDRPLSLVADIGGTNTRVGLADGDKVISASIQRFRNKEHHGLAPVLRLYLDGIGNPACDAACVAVAGPVHKGEGQLTNLDWHLSEASLAQATGAVRASLLNDLQAQGFGLPGLPPSAFMPIIPGIAEHDATQLVIGVGTGFNAAPVLRDRQGTRVPPSESGHANIPTRSPQEASLVAYIANQTGFVAVEDILSGRGLERVWGFVTKGGSANAAEIMQRLAEGDPHAEAATELFVRLLGTVTGNLSLIHLPFGGVYLVGGVSRAVQPYMERFDFAGAFRDKGRFGAFMSQFPVSLVTDDDAALVGGALYLHQQRSI